MGFDAEGDWGGVAAVDSEAEVGLAFESVDGGDGGVEAAVGEGGLGLLEVVGLVGQGWPSGEPPPSLRDTSPGGGGLRTLTLAPCLRGDRLSSRGEGTVGWWEAPSVTS